MKISVSSLAMLGLTAELRAALEGGADPNNTSTHNTCALELAASAGEGEAVELLVMYGAETTGFDGMGALMAALMVNHTDHGLQLWEHRLRVRGPGDPAFNRARPCAFEHAERLPLAERLSLVERFQVWEYVLRMRGAGDPAFDHALPYACEHAEQLPLVELFLDHGSDVNRRAKTGVTPLIVAAGKGNLPAVKLLVARGAKLQAFDRSERTALTHAEEGGFVEVADYLRSQGAKPLPPGNSEVFMEWYRTRQEAESGSVDGAA